MAVVLALVGHIASELTLLLRMEENNFFKILEWEKRKMFQPKVDSCLIII